MSAIRDAASKAIEFAGEVYGANSVEDPRVEEVERDDAGWHITLSWVSRTETLGMIAKRRTYKRFDIAPDGEVKAMRIRDVG